MRPAVYVSPHSDDVCFSLGGYLADHPSGHLLTVFSRSLFAPGVELPPLPSEQRVRAVSSIREGEDRAFARRCRLEWHALGFEEPGARGRRPFGPPEPGDVERIRPALLGALRALRATWPAGARPALFVPLGIGGHVDHQAVFRSVRSDLDALRRAYDVVFYEDLPYASRAEARARTLAAFRAALPGEPVRVEHRLGPRIEAKLAMIESYRSQRTEARARIADYTPAASGLDEPHEAWWRQ